MYAHIPTPSRTCNHIHVHIQIHIQGVKGALTKGGNELQSFDTFEIASITKTFTSTLVLLFHERGKLDITKSINNYIRQVFLLIYIYVCK